MNVRAPVTLDVAAETARCRHPDAERRGSPAIRSAKSAGWRGTRLSAL